MNRIVGDFGAGNDVFTGSVKDDYFRGAISHTSQAWKAAGLEHDFADVPGPHDYPFNRGPGAIEMLLWHDRMLARS